MRPDAMFLLFPLTVIRAKVVGETEVDSGNDIYGNPIKRIQYEVKQIKVRSFDFFASWYF